ncbi:MAG: ABC transporter permease [Actinomycetota bacterium]
MKNLNPRLKSGLIAAGFVTVTLLVTQALLPGGDGHGTPLAILFTGLVSGLLNGLLAVGIVLIYRSSRIINFAQGALGGAGGVFAYNLATILNWPFLLAFAAGVLIGGVIGMAVELGFIRRFFNAPRLVLTVFTIALLAFLEPAANFIATLPIFRVQDQSAQQLRGRVAVKVPFNDFHFQIGDLPLKFGFSHLFAIVMVVAALVALGLFLRYSRFGIAIRASAENVDRARLLGINVGSLSLTVWVIAGLLSGLAVVLTGSISANFSVGFAPPAVLLTALAAAVIARMRSLPIAVAAAVGISILHEAVKWSFEKQLPLINLGTFIAILVALLIQREKLQRSEASEASSWKATAEQRPIPKEMLEVSGVRNWKYAVVTIGLLFLLGFPWIVATRQVNLGGYVLIVAIVCLSLVVLTGWAGQVSLGQFSFVAIGAILGGAISTRFSFWLAIPVVPVLTAGFAVLIGLPALRIKGLFLGITTFALAFAVQAVLFKKEYFGWLLPESVERPKFLLLNFEDERSMYYLILTSVVLVVVMLAIMRRSRPGRVLISIRENETNVQSFGVNLLRTKLAAFALSGFICGFAGVLLAHHQRAVQASSFDPSLSLDVFLYTVVGGVGSVAGALLGAAYFALNQFLPTTNPLSFIVGRVGVLLLLYVAPGGLASLVFGLRDGMLRIVAQRRQMIVPSLFADFDPLAMARRLIPIAEPIPSQGLNALPHHQRYKAASELYGMRGRTIESKKLNSDADAFGSAAKSITAAEEKAEAVKLGASALAEGDEPEIGEREE